MSTGGGPSGPAGDGPAADDGGGRPGEPTDADLLRQWEEKIAAVGDPFGALADVLAQGAAQRATLFQQVGERVLGCELRAILGAGGMGVTYGGVAADGAPVAVKLVVGVGDTAAARFAQECRLLRAFDHPAIVRYRDHAVLDDGTGVLVMARVDGIDLEHLLQDVQREAPPATVAGAALLHEVRGGLAERLQSPRYQRRVLRLLASVAEGLAAAHRKGLSDSVLPLGRLPGAPRQLSAHQREQAAPPRTQNLAQCGWFKATGRDASASVAPNSNCGS